MIAVLLVTHGQLGSGMINAAEMLVGKSEKLDSLSLLPDYSVDQYRQDILDSINKFDDGDGVLVFIDVLGGSPYNATAGNLGKANFECIAGVNLCSLLAALDERANNTLTDLVAICVSTAKDGVADVKKIF
jgi:PTS system mannose-specific IIA component